MDLMYPRTVSAARGVTSLATGIAASIQFKKVRPRLSADPQQPDIQEWIIFCKLAIGTFLSGDVITDDQGLAYFVAAPYFTGMGYALDCFVLDVTGNALLWALTNASVSVTLETVTPGTYDPTTGSATPTTSSATRNAVLTDFTSAVFGQTLVPQTRINAGDVRCLLDASGDVPTTGAFVTISGVKYAVLEVQSVRINSIVVAYELHLRR